jgi:hypothetical protein
VKYKYIPHSAPDFHGVSPDESFNHPKGSIILTDGTCLPCAPKASDPVLDPSWEDIFLKNAHLLVENAGKILSDSRLFLCPTPFTNNLAYFGTHLLANPVLGVYAEWWSRYPEIAIRDGCPVYFIAGSPLSGSNSCEVVTASGKSKNVQFSPFMPVWKSFAQINSRYNSIKGLYEALPLSEVVKFLE